MRSSTVLAAVAALAAPAVAELAVTAPIGSTTCSGGQRCTIAWNDDNKGVSLTDQGNCTVALYTGGKSQQTFLQPIAFPDPINVATTASIEFTVDPSIGENGQYYFIRITSVDFKNPTAPTQPYLSFSAVFTLDNMTGTFNQTVKDQLKDVNTGATGPTSPITTAKPSSTPATTRSSTSPRASSTSGNSTGAGFVNATPVTATGVVAFIGTVLSLFI